MQYSLFSLSVSTTYSYPPDSHMHGLTWPLIITHAHANTTLLNSHPLSLGFGNNFKNTKKKTQLLPLPYHTFSQKSRVNALSIYTLWVNFFFVEKEAI